MKCFKILIYGCFVIGTNADPSDFKILTNGVPHVPLSILVNQPYWTNSVIIASILSLKAMATRFSKKD